MFALVDCDHFFVSCERVFRPDLWHKPVAVLSNNDGCIIARSPEVKALGIKMGTPLFQCKAILRQHQVSLFSSNFSLYADLSSRVINTIKSMIESSTSLRVEVYSIDEAFIDLKGWHHDHLESLANSLRQTIFKQTGIPVSIGIGLTKTLAKVATRLAKDSCSGTYLISSERDRLKSLYQLPIADVWGIGRRWADRLQRLGIDRAFDLSIASHDQIKRAARHSYLLRVAKELNGERCIPLNLSPPARSSIQYSRSFAHAIKDRAVLEDMISAFAGQLGRRLRSHNLRAGSLLLWLSAPLINNYKHKGKSSTYRLKMTLALPTYTDDSSTLIQCALHLMSLLIKKAKYETSKSFSWRKAGLIAVDLRDDSQLELALIQPNPKRRKLSQLEDELNRRFGRGTARLGGIPIKVSKIENAPSWSTKQAFLSPKYTTSWADLPIVYA
jgi:DNA polymerase V